MSAKQLCKKMLFSENRNSIAADKGFDQVYGMHFSVELKEQNRVDMLRPNSNKYFKRRD